MLPSALSHYLIQKTISCCSNCFHTFEQQEVFLCGTTPSRFGSSRVTMTTSVDSISFNLPIRLSPRRDRYTPVCVACFGDFDLAALPTPLRPLEVKNVTPRPVSEASPTARPPRTTHPRVDALTSFLSDL